MFLSWWRSRPQSAVSTVTKSKRVARRRPLANRLRTHLFAELLEDRLTPTATLTMPGGPFTAAQNGMITIPINISALTDGSKVGLSAATVAITWTAVRM